MAVPRREKTDSVSFLSREIARFIEEREWGPFHSPKNLSMGVAIEAAELMEHFQWLSPDESHRKVRSDDREAVQEEVADVAIFLMRLAQVCGFDLGRAILDKLKKNAVKYPVPLVRGKPFKYTYYQKKGARNDG